MLALAHHERGSTRMKDQAALAALVGGTRARVTQGMSLLYLAPDIEEETLEGRAAGVLHRDLLQVATEPVWMAQRARWRGPQSRLSLRGGRSQID